MIKETPQPYILTQDTESIFSLLDVRYPKQSKAQIDQYLDELVQAISLAYPNIETYIESDIQAVLGSKVSATLKQNPQRICLCLDRFLLQDVELQFPDQFTRLSINRTVDGQKTPRQGNLPLNEQIKSIVNFVGNKSLILVDDGLFSGGTALFVIDKLFQSGLKKEQVEKIIAFLGNSQTTHVDNIPFELIADIPDLFEWIDIRDFGLFGGKQLAASRNNAATSAVPYLYPWSMGEGASLDKNGQLFTISQKMIQSFISLIRDFETTTGKSLNFRDLLKAGFPLPSNQEKTIPVSINTNLRDYLNNCLELIETEKKRAVVIFDMDGTLYELDGENNGYSGSTLEAKVLNNCLSFIVKQENCTNDEASQIIQAGLNNAVGLSQYLSERYAISREDYFNIVWDIEPQGLVYNFQIAAQTVKKISESGKKLVLLTSAPKVWQEKVVEFLGINNLFEAIYTGEDFSQKEEIFSMLAQRYEPFKILSIGDQETTDIAPAAALGLSTLLIRNPNDLERLVK